MYKFPAYLEDMRYCHVHDNTKNTSFIDMAVVLRRMGIKNHMFHLALYDDTLRYVDPHDVSNLTAVQMEKIATECKRNPWYALRECVRIPVPGGAPIPFRLSRANLALTWLVFQSVNTYLTMSRQTGKTIGTQAIVAIVKYIIAYNYAITLITKDATLVQDNVVRLKEIRDSLPPYMVYKQSGDTENKEGLAYTMLKNRYITKIGLSDKVGANKVGRGSTTPFLHFDEIAFTSNIHIIYPAATAAMLEAAKAARAADQPTARILTTTASHLDTPSGAFAYNIKEQCINFRESFYDLQNYDELADVIDKGSENFMVYVTYSFRQLGLSTKWLEDVIRENSLTQAAVETDYLNIWKMGSDSSVIPDNVLTEVNGSEKEPDHVEIQDNIVLNFYYGDRYTSVADIENKAQIIFGSDFSENIGRDYTTNVGVDAYDISTTLTMRCNESNYMVMAELIARLLMRFKKSVWVPERNATGANIIERVAQILHENGYNPWKKIYNIPVQERQGEYGRFDINMEPYDGVNKKYFGFRTTSGKNGRDMLYKQSLMKALYLAAKNVRDASLIHELRKLKVIKGRIDHDTGGHDDTVIAYLLACYFIFFGKNIDMYGIDKSRFVAGVKDPNSEIEKLKEEQMRLRVRIAEIEARRDRCTSQQLKDVYNRELRQLKMLIRDDIVVADNISAGLDNRVIAPSRTDSSGIDLRSLHNAMKMISRAQKGAYR